MNTLAHWLADDPWLQVLALVALAVTAIAASTLVFVWLDRRGPTVRRHAVALAGLGAIAAVPFGVGLARGAGTGLPLLPLPEAPTITARTASAPPIAGGQAVAAEPLPPAAPASVTSPADMTPTAAATPPVAFAWPPVGTSLAWFWLLAGTTWTCRRAWLLQRLRRHVSRLPVASPPLQRTAAALARSLGLRAAPMLHVAATVCPATIGFGRPRLLLPADLATAFPPSTARAILRHELAHVALGHHRDAVLQTLLLAWFGWHPLVRRLSRTLDQLHEDLADNAAVADGSATDAVAYARGLLTLAERATERLPAPTLSILGGSPFSRRIDRLIRGATETMIHPDPRSRCCAAAVATTALLLPFAVRALPAQSAPAPTTDARSAATWFPLPAGHRLTWRVTGRSGDQAIDRQCEAVVWGDVPLGDGTSCAQVFQAASADLPPQVSYWRADTTGLWQFRNTYIGLRGVNREHPTRLIPGPIGSETRWEWDEDLPYQVMMQAGEEQREFEAPTAHHVGELLALHEDVTVPAGKFATMHIRITTTGSLERVVDQWFAAGVGLVKSVATEANGQLTKELLRHAAASTPAPDHAAILKDALGLQRGEPTHWLSLDSAAFHLRCRFAIVRPRVGHPTCWVVDDRAQPIGTDDLPAWQRIWSSFQASDPEFTIAALQRPAGRFLADEAPLMALASLAAQVECARRNLQIGRTTRSESTTAQKPGDITAVAAVAAVDLDGQEHELQIHVDQRGDALVALKVTCEVPAPSERPLPPQQAGPQPGQIRGR